MSALGAWHFRLIGIAVCVLLFGFAQPAHAVTAPTITPGNGTYATPQSVTMSAPAGNIYYTLDGTSPTNASTLYSSAITISSTTQINAVAYQSGTYSTVSTAYLDVDSALAPLKESSISSYLFLRLKSNFGVITSNSAFPNLVTQWTDLSGQGHNVTGGSGTEPTLAVTAPGMYGVKFDGTSQFLSLPSSSASWGLGGCFFLVVAPNSPTSGARFFDFGNGSTTNSFFMSQPSTNGVDFQIFNGSTGSSVSSSSAVTLGQFQLLEGRYISGSPSTVTIFANGIQKAQSTSMQPINVVARNNNYIGRASGGGNYYSGSIAELIMYNNQLTSMQRAAIAAYLIQKYQLLSLAPSAPVIGLPGGTLSGPAQVTITSQPNSVTFVTTDGSTPTTSSPVYSGPIIVNYTQTIKAMSSANGLQSSVTSATYTLDSAQWPEPSPGDTTAPAINLQLPVPSL